MLFLLLEYSTRALLCKVYNVYRKKVLHYLVTSVSSESYIAQNQIMFDGENNVQKHGGHVVHRTSLLISLCSYICVSSPNVIGQVVDCLEYNFTCVHVNDDDV